MARINMHTYVADRQNRALLTMRSVIPGLWNPLAYIGGGASSGVWNQIKADVLNTPYQRLQRAEFGIWGSAIIAGKAVGVFSTTSLIAPENLLARFRRRVQTNS